MKVEPRSSWTSYQPDFGSAIPMGGLWMQHHTAGNYVEPEAGVREGLEEGPPIPHLGILWHGKREPGWAAKAKILRRHGLTKWNQMEVRKRGGDKGWVVVRIDPVRAAQLRAKQKAERAAALAGVLRIKALEKRTMRAIEDYHLSLGWKAIGYGVVGFPSGRLYAGRAAVVAGRITAMYHGAHCPGFNHRPSFSWAGNYSKDRLTDRLEDSTVELLRGHGCTHYIGHREAPYPTSCPGVSSAVLDRIAGRIGARRSR